MIVTRIVTRGGTVDILKEIRRRKISAFVAIKPDPPADMKYPNSKEHIPGKTGHIDWAVLVKGSDGTQHGEGGIPCGENGTKSIKQGHFPAIDEKILYSRNRVLSRNLRQYQRNERKDKYNNHCNRGLRHTFPPGPTENV